MASTQNRFAYWNPFRSDLFTAYGNNKLEVCQIVKEGASQRIEEMAGIDCTLATCVEWSSGTPNTLAFGDSSGDVAVWNWEKSKKISVCEAAHLSKRICNALSWNKVNPNKLAAGFENFRGEYCAIVWDFTEKATLKVSYGESASAINWFPTNANLVAIGTSMGWVRVYDTRTGGQVMSVMANPATRPRKVKGIRFDPFNQNNFVTFSDVPGETVKVWDIRRIVSSKSAVKNAGFLLSIRSEDNFGITGIITDVAWSPARAGVVAVANSHQRCISLFNTVKSNADNSSSSPILSISTSETVKCISWQGISQQHALQSGDVIKAEEILKGNDFEGNNKPTWEPFSVELTDNLATISDSFVSSSPANLLEGSLSFNRMLLTVTGGFIELDLRERVPIAFGGTGKILVAQGKNAIQLDTEKCAKSNDGEYRDSLFDTDWLSKKYRISMEFIMKRRCQLGYSLDASENIEIIAAQLDAVHNAIQLDPTHSLDSQSSVQEFIAITSKVYRVWVWIDRIETLKSGQEGLSLSNCGVLSILRSDGEFSNDIGRNSIETKHEMTGALIYQSKSRNLCKHVCGWTELWGIVNPSRDCLNLSEDELLHSIVEECEQHDSFERAAAIALWHGNIDLAVDVISRAMSRSKSDKHGVPKNEDCVVDESYQSFDLIEWDVPVDDSYQSTLSLVGVCFAGYHSNFSLNKDTQLQRNQSWGKMCNYVICELERSSRKSSAYLIACCCFLLDVLYSRPGLDVCYERIINNESLALEDRIGFGSIYLNDNLFSAWINQTTYSCLEYGNIEGILLCGFTTSGLNVIQRFIDKYSDLQTAALLIGRILEKRQNSSPEFLWLSEYRAMLNQWQMFTERALLDVQMGSLFRQKDEDKMYKKEKKGEVRGSGKMNNQFAKRNLHSKSGGGEKLKRSMYDLPQHTNYTFLYLRCNFCGAALPVDAMRIAHAETLRVQKSLIGCCANCKQRLPRCYVCQTQMNMVNPFKELNRTMTWKRIASDLPETRRTEDDTLVTHQLSKSSEHNAVDSKNWHYFCQHCRHGGHASCICNWFGNLYNHGESRVVCGVNGCNCSCSSRR